MATGERGFQTTRTCPTASARTGSERPPAGSPHRARSGCNRVLGSDGPYRADPAGRERPLWRPGAERTPGSGPRSILGRRSPGHPVGAIRVEAGGPRARGPNSDHPTAPTTDAATTVASGTGRSSRGSGDPDDGPGVSGEGRGVTVPSRPNDAGPRRSVAGRAICPPAHHGAQLSKSSARPYSPRSAARTMRVTAPPSSAGRNRLLAPARDERQSTARVPVPALVAPSYRYSFNRRERSRAAAPATSK